MTLQIDVRVDSEVGELEAVILHRPGLEVENMEPENAEKALYSDILNLQVAREEYDQLAGVLSQVTQTFEIRDLLAEVLADDVVKQALLESVVGNDITRNLTPADLASEPSDALARQFIEGVLMTRNTLTSFLSKEIYGLSPLHNFLFVRDAAMVIGGTSLVGKMASRVRRREAKIMDAVLRHHPAFSGPVINPMLAADADPITIEGGDVLVARDDTLLVGVGARTTSQGVDYIVEQLSRQAPNTLKHVLVQELPTELESYIHLDMVFTFLDRHQCMVFEPVIMKNNKLKPIHLTLDHGVVRDIQVEENLLRSLGDLGMDMEPVLCGGTVERTQKREQWHSGANFFAMGPGKVIGYGRNKYTIEALDKAGYSVLAARDIIDGKVKLDDYDKYVVTIRGAELARGGGGCRCLTLPIRRRPL